MQLIQRAFIATIMLMFAVTTQAEEYTIHTGPNGYAPFFMIEGSGDDAVYFGAIHDLLDIFEDRHPEYSRRPILMTAKRANLGLARGEGFDVMFNSPLFVSDDVLQYFRFTQTVFTSRDVVITRKDQEFEYTKPEDLFGQSVGAIRGYRYAQFDELLESGQISDVRVDEHPQAIGMLARGRIDAYFGNIFVSPYYIKQMGIKVSDFDFSKVSMYEFEFAFAVNKEKPELYKKLDTFISDIRYNGVLKRLLKSYLE